MARRLKGGMPKLFADNRCPEAKRLREIYEDIERRFTLGDGLNRRIAGLTAKAWLDYEQLSRELHAITEKPRLQKTGKGSCLVARLRRRQSAMSSSFLSGLRTLEGLTSKVGGQDLAKAFEEALRVEQEDTE